MSRVRTAARDRPASKVAWCASARGTSTQETAYGDDPVAVAGAFADAGAGWLHVVDLDGARAGEPRQLGLAAAIVAEVHGRMRVEIGGGLRTGEAIAGALGTGAARAVIGTALLRDPDFAATLVARHGPDRLVASIDVRDGLALGEGWREGAPGLPATEAVVQARRGRGHDLRGHRHRA